MPDFPVAYWSQYGQAIINQLELKKLAVGEWHGACPNCGGKDRFWISEYKSEVRVHCRQCNDFAEIQKALTSMGLWPSKDNIVQLREREVPNNQGWFEDDAPYHIRKGVELHGAVLDGNTVVVPLFNAQREKVGHQRISPDGQKRFSTGLAKDGAFGVCGKITHGKAYICEGWATACSVYMAHQEDEQAEQCAAIFALDAGNLPKVCEALQEAFPKLELIIAADNDEPGIKAAKATGKPYAAPGTKGADWNDIHAALGAAAVRQGLRGAKTPAKLFTHVSDIEMKPPAWLIEGMLEQEALTMCFGSPGAGKTFAVLDMAMCIAAGKAWHGKEVEQGLVLYIAGEGHAGFARRVAAWSKANDVSLSEVPFYKSNSAVIMNDETDAEELQQELQSIADSIGKPKLIVLDTLARTMIGDENSSERVGEYIKALDSIKQQYNCTVLIVHHTVHGNQNRARGSSVLYGALDAEFKVGSWGDNKVLIESTKMKDAEEPEAMAFIKMPVELVTPNGEETSSLVLEYIADKPRSKKDPDYIRQVIIDQISTVDAFGEAQRADLKEAVGLELECSQRTANRYIKKLIDEGVLAQRGGAVVVA